MPLWVYLDKQEFEAIKGFATEAQKVTITKKAGKKKGKKNAAK